MLVSKHLQDSAAESSPAGTQQDASGFAPIADDKLFEYAERVKDKVAVITGGAKGIGKEAAERFASSGAKIVIGDLDIAGAEETVSEIRAAGGQAFACKCNVTEYDDQVALFELALEKFGSVDIIVANAGVGEPTSFLTLKFDENGKPVKPTMSTVQVNLIGTMYTVHLAQHYLLVNREPETKPLKTIVLLGSMASWGGLPLAPVYCATKHGVLGLMRSLDPILALKGIRIATITPFFADTAILPTVLRLGLAGIPLTPVPRIAGAIFYAASHPDPDTSGCGYVLPDNGPVFKVPREEFKLGVYKLLDERANALLKGGRGVRYIVRTIRDVVRTLKKPILVSVFVVGVAFAVRMSQGNLRRYIGF